MEKPLSRRRTREREKKIVTIAVVTSTPQPVQPPRCISGLEIRGSSLVLSVSWLTLNTSVL